MVAPTNTSGQVQTGTSVQNVVLCGESLQPGVISTTATGTTANRSGFYPLVPPPAAPSASN
jgi:hypothetical protein